MDYPGIVVAALIGMWIPTIMYLVFVSGGVRQRAYEAGRRSGHIDGHIEVVTPLNGFLKHLAECPRCHVRLYGCGLQAQEPLQHVLKHGHLHDLHAAETQADA